MFSSPRATGPYAIGTVTHHWVYADRRELFTTDPYDRRELMVQIRYPANQAQSSPRALYMSEADVVAQALARLLGVPEFTLEELKGVNTNAVEFAPVADDEPA